MGWVVNATHLPLYPRERPGTHCIGGWVGPMAGLDGCGKSRPYRDSIPDRRARSESLYRQRYPGSLTETVITRIRFQFDPMHSHLLVIHVTHKIKKGTLQN